MENKTLCILVVLFILFLDFFCGCATVPGTLDIISNPPAAVVYFDNQYRGITPLTLADVPPGNHSLELRLDGFKTWTTSGIMDDGGHVEVEVTLVPVSFMEHRPATASVTPRVRAPDG